MSPRQIVMLGLWERHVSEWAISLSDEDGQLLDQAVSPSVGHLSQRMNMLCWALGRDWLAHLTVFSQHFCFGRYTLAADVARWLHSPVVSCQ
jgi:hypothetical protein